MCRSDLIAIWTIRWSSTIHSEPIKGRAGHRKNLLLRIRNLATKNILGTHGSITAIGIQEDLAIVNSSLGQNN